MEGGRTALKEWHLDMCRRVAILIEQHEMMPESGGLCLKRRFVSFLLSRSFAFLFAAARAETTRAQGLRGLQQARGGLIRTPWQE